MVARVREPVSETCGSVARVSDQWTEWAARRPEPRLMHLDSAAAGRQSIAVLDAVADHARLESEVGAYVAQESVAEVLDRLRADMAGLLGVSSDGVAFVESASAGRQALLTTWPLPPTATVGVLAVEWGPNLEAFAAHGLDRILLPADGSGRLDLADFERVLADAPPTVVHLTQVTSHRGLVQPVTDAARLCRRAGVPLWVDAAQAIGHVDTATGADAVYATSRKWLAGPRGVGVLAVADSYRDTLRVRRSAMLPDDVPTVARLESHEAHVAGRIGLAGAIREYLDDGASRVRARLDEVGRATRAALGEVRGWALTPDDHPQGAITAIRPLDGQDVAATRARLLTENGILTTAGGTARAPGDMREPLLRISPHIDCTAAQLEALCAALTS